MKPAPTSRRTEASTVDVDTAPITLVLPRGSVVFALRGEAWITQEGRHEDIVLAAGDRFEVSDTRSIVASATRGQALLYIARPVGACRAAARDLYDFARCRAGELRREELVRLGGALSAAARRWAHRVGAALATRRGLTRLTTH